MGRTSPRKRGRLDESREGHFSSKLGLQKVTISKLAKRRKRGDKGKQNRAVTSETEEGKKKDSSENSTWKCLSHPVRDERNWT